MNYTRLICSITLLGVVFGNICFGYNEKSAVAKAAASTGVIEYARLYSFISKRNQRYYRTNADIPKVSDGPWKYEGAVGIVAKNAAPGLMPVYQFLKADSFGARFFYAVLPKEIKTFTDGVNAAGRWTNQGVAFYVSPTKQPDMVKLFRLFVPAKIEWSGNIGSVGTMKAPEEIFLTTDTAARDKAINAGWTSSSLGYVWTKAPETPLPDLTIENTFVKGSSVVAHVRNKGKVGSPDVWVRMRILDKAGKQVSYLDQKMSATFQNMPASVISFDLGNQNLNGKSYHVKVDPINKVKEADEANNETQAIAFPAPKVNLNIDPEQANKFRAPTFAITGAQPSGQKTLYLLSVTNWQSFKPEWFQSLQNVLPPNPCGNGNTDARLQARISVIKTGMPLNAGCKPLNTQQDFKSLQFESVSALKDSDLVRITLVDRLNNTKYESDPFAIGWLGLGKVLSPLGCKYFLGRAGSFLCTSKPGYDACENLRKQGKPIKCTMAGNK